MANTNDFLPFAVGAGANVLSQSDFAALPALNSGFQAGTAISAQLNKVWRQSSVMSAVLAQFIVNNSGQPAVDDGTTAALLANLNGAIRALTRQQVVLADTGSANAYAAVNVPAIAALPTSSGLVQSVSVANANTGASTYAPDGLAAKPILGMGLSALQGGELPAKGVATLLYVVAPTVNNGNGAWVLIECTGGAQQIAPATASQHAVQLGQVSQMQTISATVAANALMLTAGPTLLSFRAVALTSGVPVQAWIPIPLTLSVPSGATLGTVGGQVSSLALLVAYNGGAPVLCVANVAGGLNLDETTLISPTTISAASNSASTIYSATSVAANSPFRVVGYVTITEATAGAWAIAPTLVQGVGGQAMAGMQTLGFGQSWQNVVGSRALGTTYYNTTSRPIFLSADIASPSNARITALVNGVPVQSAFASAGADGVVALVISPGASYSISGGTTINAWAELR